MAGKGRRVSEWVWRTVQRQGRVSTAAERDKEREGEGEERCHAHHLERQVQPDHPDHVDHPGRSERPPRAHEPHGEPENRGP